MTKFVQPRLQGSETEIANKNDNWAALTLANNYCYI